MIRENPLNGDVYATTKREALEEMKIQTSRGVPNLVVEKLVDPRKGTIAHGMFFRGKYHRFYWVVRQKAIHTEADWEIGPPGPCFDNL